MAEKKTTINQLAKMIKKSFDNVDKKIDEKFTQVATKEQVKNIEKRLNSMDEKLKGIDGLETRILDIENVLNMPTVKSK